MGASPTLNKTIEPPLLETRRLSMRFGGLTAVGDIDIRIERGRIFSVIGPNGAGKTTLFNCISGVLRPTAGTVRVAGRDVRRAWSWRILFGCLTIALATALTAAGLASNPNGLWRAVIRRPTNFSDQPFSWRAILPNAMRYLRGELAVERQAGRWNVVTADGSVLLASFNQRLKAEQLRAAYEDFTRLRPEASTDERVGETWRLRPLGESTRAASANNADSGLVFTSRAAALAKRDQLIVVSQERRWRRRLTWAASFGGFVVGSLGVLSVWNRSRWTPEVVAAAGVARTFQNLRLFKQMTARDNVLVGLETIRPALSAASRLEEAHRLLEWVGLTSHAHQRAGALAYGDQRRLEIARALAVRPRLLLLDEPAAGMSSRETADLMDLIRAVRDRGITVVLIEHEMKMVMGISDHVLVLDYGRKIAEGPPQQVQQQPSVIEAYLGPQAD